MKLSTPPPTTSAIGYGTPARRDSQPSTTEQSSRKTTTWISAMAGFSSRGLQRAVAQFEHAPGARRQPGIVRHQHEGCAARFGQAHHRLEYFIRRLRIEVAGRLVGQH